MLPLIKLHSKITIKKVTIMGLLLALFLIFSFISQILKISIFPVAGFLKLEFVAFILLISVESVGIVWATLLCVIGPLIRLSFDPDLVGIFALIIAYCTFVWIYFFAKYPLINYALRKKLTNKTPAKVTQVTRNDQLKSTIPASIIAMIGVSLVLVACNYAFILRLYILFLKLPGSAFQSIYVPLIGIILAFNIITYSINVAIFLAIAPSLQYMHLEIYWEKIPPAAKTHVRIAKDYQQNK